MTLLIYVQIFSILQPLMLELLGAVLALLLVSPVRTEFISPHLQVYDELCELFTFDRGVSRDLMINIFTFYFGQANKSL